MPHTKEPPPALAVTAGVRESIGAEVLAKAWRVFSERSRHPNKNSLGDTLGDRLPLSFFSLGGNKKDFETFSIPCQKITEVRQANAIFPHALPLLQEGLEARASLDQALILCREGKASGVVTLPVEKKVFGTKKSKTQKNEGQDEVSEALRGHTEYIADAFGIKEYGMLLAWRRVRTLPISRHVSLRQAVESLDKESIVSAARLVYKALVEDFGIKKPRLALAALNPHAGEGGLCGDEEETLLRPAIACLRKEGIVLAGPYPSDSLFLPAMRKTFDCALTLYHDQGLIPLKLLSLQRAVNITLGLPIVRCSPDHGTARNLVGLGVADPASLVAALAMAWRIAQRRQKKQ